MSDDCYYGRVHATIEARPGECWLGLRVRRTTAWERGRFFACVDVWLQLLPCLALHLWWFPGYRVAGHLANGRPRTRKGV